MLNLGKFAKTMDRSSNNCIREGKKNNFPVFSEVYDPKERTDKPIYRGQILHRADLDDEAGCFKNEEDIYDEKLKLEDCDAAEMISTDIFEKLHFRSAETLLLNGDRSTL